MPSTITIPTVNSTITSIAAQQLQQTHHNTMPVTIISGENNMNNNDLNNRANAIQQLHQIHQPPPEEHSVVY